MKALLALLLACASLSCAPVLAQNTVARFIFEDAEKAFARKDYVEALSLLREAEETLGRSNPPILHLRLKARAALISEKGPFAEFHQVEAARVEARKLLDDHANDLSEEEAREAYRIFTELKRLPASEEEWNARMAPLRAQAQAQREQEAARAAELRQAQERRERAAKRVVTRQQLIAEVNERLLASAGKEDGTGGEIFYNSATPLTYDPGTHRYSYRIGKSGWALAGGAWKEEYEFTFRFRDVTAVWIADDQLARKRSQVDNVGMVSVKVPHGQVRVHRTDLENGRTYELDRRGEVNVRYSSASSSDGQALVSAFQRLTELEKDDEIGL